jgi:hypothetical protein
LADMLLPPPLEDKPQPGQAAPGADVLTMPPPADTRLEESLEAASKVSPEQAGQVRALSRKTGLDPEYVAGNVEAVRAASARPSTEALQAIREHLPVTAKHLEDPANAAVTQDDVANLAMHEGVVNQAREATSLLESFRSGLQGSASGLIARRHMPDLALGPGAPLSRRVAAQAGALLGDFPFMAAGSAAGAAGLGAAGTVVGTGAGGPFGGMALGLAGTEVGASAGAFALPAAVKEAMREHLSGERLKPGAIFKAAGLQGLVGALTAGAGAVAEPLGAVASTSAEVATMATAGAAIEGRRPTAADFADTAVLVAGLHAVGKLGELAPLSKLRARDPEGYKDHVGTLMAGLPLAEPKIPVAAFERYWQSANIDPAQAAEDLGVSESYAEAQKTGGHVSVPMGAFMSREMDAHRPNLLEDVTFQQPDGRVPPTLNERKEKTAAIGEQLKAEAAASDEAVKADAKMRAGYDTVFGDVRGKLDMVPRPEYFKTDAEWEKYKDLAAATQARRSVATAARRGLDPEQVYRGTISDIVADGTDDEKDAAARAEELDRLSANGGLTPVKDFIKQNGGIDTEAARKYGWAAELPDLERSGIFRRGGMTPDTAARCYTRLGCCRSTTRTSWPTTCATRCSAKTRLGSGPAAKNFPQPFAERRGGSGFRRSRRLRTLTSRSLKTSVLLSRRKVRKVRSRRSLNHLLHRRSFHS